MSVTEKTFFPVENLRSSKYGCHAGKKEATEAKNITHVMWFVIVPESKTTVTARKLDSMKTSLPWHEYNEKTSIDDASVACPRSRSQSTRKTFFVAARILLILPWQAQKMHNPNFTQLCKLSLSQMMRTPSYLETTFSHHPARLRPSTMLNAKCSCLHEELFPWAFICI